MKNKEIREILIRLDKETGRRQRGIFVNLSRLSVNEIKNLASKVELDLDENVLTIVDEEYPQFLKEMVKGYPLYVIHYQGDLKAIYDKNKGIQKVGNSVVIGDNDLVLTCGRIEDECVNCLYEALSIYRNNQINLAFIEKLR